MMRTSAGRRFSFGRLARADGRPQVEKSGPPSFLKKSKNAVFGHRLICGGCIFRHNIIEDFGEVIIGGYKRFIILEKEIQELRLVLKKISLQRQSS